MPNHLKSEHQKVMYSNVSSFQMVSIQIPTVLRNNIDIVFRMNLTTQTRTIHRGYEICRPNFTSTLFLVVQIDLSKKLYGFNEIIGRIVFCGGGIPSLRNCYVLDVSKHLLQA